MGRYLEHAAPTLADFSESSATFHRLDTRVVKLQSTLPSVDLTRRAQTLARSTASEEPKGIPNSTRNGPPGYETRANQSLLLLLRGRHLCRTPKPQSAPAVSTVAAMTTVLMPAVAVAVPMAVVLVPMLMTTAVIPTTVAAVIASAVVPIVAIAVAVVCVATGQKQRYE